MTPHDLWLFDLDGTLSDPILGIGRSINYALARYGYAELAPDQISQYVGPPLDISFRAITGTSSDAHVEELVLAYRDRYGDVGFAENTLYPAIPALLQQLHTAGVPMGICTSKRADFAQRILQMFELDIYFGFISGGEINLQKWQQLAALKAGGTATAASLMIGDRAVDITAAHKNGLSAAGVLWGHGAPAELEAEQPRYLFSSPLQLLTLLQA